MLNLIRMMAAMFTYKCGRCGYVEQYGTPKGGLKCPKCGFSMFKQ
jgi:DNA-directed RNA polymerase subunit RPC12/RpoP